MSIVGLERLVYGVEDLALAGRFFTQWGLVLEGDCFRAEDGTGVELRAAADPSLPPAVEPGSTVRETVWGVDSGAELDALARRIGEAVPVRRGGDGSVGFVDPAGFGVSLVPTRRRALAARAIPVNTPERRRRIDTVGAFYKRASP